MYAILNSKHTDTQMRISKGSELVVGRNPGDNENGFTIDNQYISRIHAVFTYKNELCIQDMDSKNGSFVNGRRLNKDEMIPLSEGDFIKLGDIEFRLHYDGKTAGDRIEKGIFKYEMRNTVGGRKLQISTDTRGCVKYQIRMIEENPSLCIADVTHVSSIQNDCFLCDLGEYMSLPDMMEQKPGRVNWVEIFEKMLKAVKNGEECMLNRSKYIISPDTVFIDMRGNIRLIYVPCVNKPEDRFAEGLAALCDFFLKKCRDNDRKKLLEMKSICRREMVDTAELMKGFYKLKDCKVEIRREIPVMEMSTESTVSKLKAEYLITFLSFAALIAVVWTGKLSTTNIAALFLIVAGINVIIYGNKSKVKKKTDNAKKKEKSSGEFMQLMKKLFSKE